MNNKRRRLYDIIAYEEYFVDLMCNIQTLEKVRWYWVFHNQDKREDGTLKDEHYHILLYFEDAITISSLMKKIKFDRIDRINYYDKGTEQGRLDYRIRYLIHFKSKDEKKFEYNVCDIQTNDENYERFFNNDDRKQYNDINLIFDFFDNVNHYVTFKSFLNYVYQSDLWGTYQRNAVTFQRLLDEHNEQYFTNHQYILKKFNL